MPPIQATPMQVPTRPALPWWLRLPAAILPVGATSLIGGLAIVGTFLMLRVASEFTSVSIFALNLVTGLGLGLAIDYSLFMVSRYREEIARSGPGMEAMRRTMATAGRTVLFSSLTVAASLASLLIFPQRFLYSMGLGGSLVALIAAALALIVLPAILALLGTRNRSVQEIAEELPISRPAVSRHLRVLKDAGLVAEEAVGTRRIYHLEPGGALAVRDYLERVWGEAAVRFRLLAENTGKSDG